MGDFSIEAYFFTFYSTLQYITLILITISVETNTRNIPTAEPAQFSKGWAFEVFVG